MKLRACIRVLLAAIVVLAAASAGAAGKKQQPFRPFWGNATGEVHVVVPGLGECPGYFSVADVEGEMTHLGRTTFSSKHCMVMVGSQPPQTLGGTAVFTAANGDQFYVSAASFHFTKYTSALIVEEGVYTVTGGTGRFQGASGTLNVTCFVTPDQATPPWPVEIVFVGTISY